MICLTEMRRISSVAKNEKEMLCTVDGIDWEIFMTSRYLPPKLRSRAPNGFEVWQLDFRRTSAGFQIFRRKELIERRRAIRCAVNPIPDLWLPVSNCSQLLARSTVPIR